MKIILAGYNVDAEVLDAMKAECKARNDVTPEVLSAAYARISRDPRAIDEIRKDAREEVERTRRSNETIIFKMGHHSVAEHAIFNFDIIGLSRYAMESLEKFRLCSYTEKSQRYITLEDDFVVPPEIRGTAFEPDFVNVIREQNELYRKLYDALREYVFAKHPDLASNPKKHSLLEGWAKEDARYATALATEAQVGLTVNARNLELMLRRFASHPLTEVKELGRLMYEKVKKIAPSIILFHAANDLDEKTYPDLVAFGKELFERELLADEGAMSADVRLVDYDESGDECIAAALLHSVTSHSFEHCRARVEGMSTEEKQSLFKAACRHLQFYDSVPREFEYAHLTYNMVISAACFGQLKRHRMTSITAQNYIPELGVTIPRSIIEIGMENDFQAVVQKTNELYDKIQRTLPPVAPYILTNAHKRRVLVRTNIRELYHMSRLREDEHAQWDIREKTACMSKEARTVMPLACMLLGGKNAFVEVYEKAYGFPPKVQEAVLPGVKKIR